jgi:hypothetical protein
MFANKKVWLFLCRAQKWKEGGPSDALGGGRSRVSRCQWVSRIAPTWYGPCSILHAKKLGAGILYVYLPELAIPYQSSGKVVMLWWALDLQDVCIEILDAPAVPFWKQHQSKMAMITSSTLGFHWHICFLNKSFGSLKCLVGAQYNLCGQMKLNICCFYMTVAKRCWYPWRRVS